MPRHSHSTTPRSIIIQMKKAICLPFVTFVLTALSCFAAVRTRNLKARQIEFVNRSGKNVVVDWVNPTTGEVVTIQSDLMNGQVSFLDTFVNHTFAIHEQSNESCKAETCEIQYVTVSEKDEQGKLLDAVNFSHPKRTQLIESCFVIL
jgi:hypothetical protein